MLRAAARALHAACCAALLTAPAAAVAAPPPPPPRPNVIFILADDLGYGDLGCFGQQHIQTPELDRMAAEGIRLTAHYSGSTVCAPSRFALLRGLHLGHAPQIGQKQELQPGDQTLGTVFRQAGYRTAAIGKWGLGAASGHPNEQGFDHWFGFLDQTRAHFHYPDAVWRNRDRVPLTDNPGSHEHYVHDLFTAEAIQFIRNCGEAPFFLYLPYTLPHAEVIVPEDSWRPYRDLLGDPERPPIGEPYALKGYNAPRYPRAFRAGMVSRLDRDVGRIRALLVDLGLADNTLVVFTSDNGPAPAGGQDIRFFASAGPFRGEKRTLYEGGIRVPTLAVWPNHIPPGSTSGVPSIFYDWLPTFAALTAQPLAAPTDGASLLPVLQGTAADTPQRLLFWDYAESGVTSRLSALREGDWKLVVDRSATPPHAELYHLARDPGERADLADREPDRVARLLALMRPFWR